MIIIANRGAIANTSDVLASDTIKSIFLFIISLHILRYRAVNVPNLQPTTLTLAFSAESIQGIPLP
jgi:hypothetical protein